MPSPLLFLFDYVSPYSYLASTQVRALAARHGRDVEAVPVVFGALLGAHGTRGPAEVAANREYLFRDVIRLGRALSVPIAPPATHPFNPLTALRATVAIADPAVRWTLVDALFRAAWVEGRRRPHGARRRRALLGRGLAAAPRRAALRPGRHRRRAARAVAGCVAFGDEEAPSARWRLTFAERVAEGRPVAHAAGAPQLGQLVLPGAT